MSQRREFLRQASVLAAGSLAAGHVTAQAAPRAAQGTWDMSWTERITGRHRMCFDAPEVAEGVCLHQARSFLAGYASVFGLTDADLSAVIVIRHAAVPMVMADALWADGFLAEKTEAKDPATGEPSRRNPYVNVPTGARHAVTWPDGALDTLIGRGVIVLACDLALQNFAGQIARHRNIPRPDALDLVRGNLIPGIYRMPTGIFATSHAQALGCGFLHAG